MCECDVLSGGGTPLRSGGRRGMGPEVGVSLSVSAYPTQIVYPLFPNYCFCVLAVYLKGSGPEVSGNVGPEDEGRGWVRPPPPPPGHKPVTVQG